MKKNIFVVLLISIISFFVIDVQAMPNATPQFYINDYANLLTNETKDYILKTSIALEKETTVQVVVVTVPSLEGQSIEEYAVELFRKYGIGTKENNNGLLLLLALEERKFRVEVGYGLEEVLTDGLTGRYQDEYIIPYLKENKWDEGIKNGYNAFVKKICDYYEVENIDISNIQTNKKLNIKDTFFDKSSTNLLLAIILGTTIGVCSGHKIRQKQKTKKIIRIVAILISLVYIFSLIASSSYSLLSTFIIVEIFSMFNFSGSVSWSSRGGSSNSGGSSSHFGGGGSSGGGGSTRGF